MRVAFIGKNHGFSLVPLARIMQAHELVGILESGPRQRLSVLGQLRLRVNDYRVLRTSGASLRGLAWRTGAKYGLLTRESMLASERLLRVLAPDIICVASLSHLLPESILGTAKYGAINLHPSLLPKYHGPFPWFWQYYNLERHIGVTVHAIDVGQDTGPIIKQTSVPLEFGTDIHDAIKHVTDVGARLMVEALAEIESGIAIYTHQPSHGFPKARIVQRNEKLVNWLEWPIERVWHVMRGTYPWLDAAEYPKRKGLGQWKPEELVRCQNAGTPGIVHCDEQGYYVAHADGKIRVRHQ